ncbi:hypothetical protein ACFC14_18565 [Microbacterium sp. NPDC055988]|uniref:hypothetical protein n=1 Tax=Microbacterium sp. NPDC055988 TaxID=3345671 RepID=UPI0035E017BE
MSIRLRDDARRHLALAVVLGPGTPFSIYDVMDEAHWYRTVVDGDGPLIIGGALLGALEVLRRHGATSADVFSCPLTSPGGVVTEEDMSLAAGWLANGLMEEPDSTAEQTAVSEALQLNGWTRDPAHVTSLVLAIALIAGHADAKRCERQILTTEYDRG